MFRKVTAYDDIDDRITDIQEVADDEIERAKGPLRHGNPDATATRPGPDVFMTNDTDVLQTNDALQVNNDLGVSFQMTDGLSTRVSYLTDYKEARAIRTDNHVSLAIVYGF